MELGDNLIRIIHIDPLSPEYFFVRFRQTLGLPPDGSDTWVDFSVSAKVGVKQQVARLKQMQNELKFLKKQINQQIKEKQVEVALQGHKRDAAANLKRLAAAPYELVTKNIDSMLVQLDGVKVKLENPQLVEKAKALESIPNKAAKPDVQ